MKWLKARRRKHVEITREQFDLSDAYAQWMAALPDWQRAEAEYCYMRYWVSRGLTESEALEGIKAMRRGIKKWDAIPEPLASKVREHIRSRLPSST